MAEKPTEGNIGQVGKLKGKWAGTSWSTRLLEGFLHPTVTCKQSIHLSALRGSGRAGTGRHAR